MRSFDAIDAELSALMGREANVTAALEAAVQFRGLNLDAIDAMLDALGVPTAGTAGPETVVPAASSSSAPLDADALFEDVGTGRQSMMAPLDAGATEAVLLTHDAAYEAGAAGDLAGLLEGSNSLMPPAPDDTGVEDVEDVGASVISLDADDDYEEMQAVTTSVDDDDLHSTEIEIVED
jgi:hypothetical protein